MAPAMIITLVVVLAGVALVLDRLWLDAASVELQTAAESAALASGGELVSDDLLKAEFDQDAIIDRARKTATAIASTNKIAGQSVRLDGSQEGDIRFGKIVVQKDTGREIFVETKHKPTSVVVRAEHSRSRNNPVALFLNALTGETGGDVAALAEASIDNHLIGLQPLDGVPVPALPLALLRDEQEGKGRQSWEQAIVKRQGADRFCFHEDNGEISSGPDGIPEITLRFVGTHQDAEESNAFLFSLFPSATKEDIRRHIQSGWDEDDFPNSRHGLKLVGQHHDFVTLDGTGSLSNELAELVGQCRIVFLYDEFETSGHSREGRIRCVSAVAGRILSLQLHDGEACEIVFQPGVLTTRTALLASEARFSRRTRERLANPYIYKLRLTH